MCTEDALMLLLQTCSSTTAPGYLCCLLSWAVDPSSIPAPGNLFPPPTRPPRACQAHPLCPDPFPHQRGTAKMSNILGFRENHFGFALKALCWCCAMCAPGQLCPSLQSLGTARGAEHTLRGLSREEIPTSGVFSLCWLWFLHSVWFLPYLSMIHTQW